MSQTQIANAVAQSVAAERTRYARISAIAEANGLLPRHVAAAVQSGETATSFAARASELAEEARAEAAARLGDEIAGHIPADLKHAGRPRPIRSPSTAWT